MALRLKKPKMKDKATLVAEWAADSFVVPAGMHAGNPLVLDPFQLDFMRDHFADDPEGGPLYRTTVLTTPRKNGKTATMGVIVSAYMDPTSPVHIPHCQAAVNAPTSKHAVLLAEFIRRLYERVERGSEWSMNMAPPPRLRNIPGKGYLHCLSGARTSGHGLDLHLAIVDEAGLMPKSNETLQNTFDAVATSDGRVILTGTRGDSPEYNEIIENPDARTKVHLYGVEKDANASDPAVWAKANPGLGRIKSRRYMEDAHEKGQAAGSLTDFRVWNLNMPLSPTRQLLLEYGDLAKAYDETCEPIPGEPCFAALDLGGSSAMTAAVIMYQESGVIRCLGAFPGEGELDLYARGKRDGVGNAYVTAAERGELFETSGAVTDLAEFLARLQEFVGNHPVLSISADRYRDAEFRTAMARAKISWPVITRGTGPKDGDNDIRATRRVFLSGKAKLRRNLLLEAGLTEADVKVSTTGAMQIDKSHRNARIDVAQALTLACAAFVADLDAPAAEMEVTVL
ncbi:MAG: terminase TerL endonuclease subunit [Roseovarius pacificus]|nr:terminase TerL endonuclease subunit [Roseovarius pacificus]